MKDAKEYWQHLAENRLRDVQNATGIRQMIANQFYLGAAHMVRLIEEHEKSETMKQWKFYRARCETLETQIRTGRA